MILTERQRELLTFIRDCEERSKLSPTITEIAFDLGISRTRVAQILRTLKMLDKITSEKGRHRSIKIVK